MLMGSLVFALCVSDCLCVLDRFGANTIEETILMLSLVEFIVVVRKLRLGNLVNIRKPCKYK